MLFRNKEERNSTSLDSNENSKTILPPLYDISKQHATIVEVTTRV